MILHKECHPPSDKVWNVTVLTFNFVYVRMVLPRKRGALNSNKSPSRKSAKQKAIAFTDCKKAAAFAKIPAILKDEVLEMEKKKRNYSPDLPRRLYSFFVGYAEQPGAPSFSKFARSIGATSADLQAFRKHKEFERAYNECNEIRRDYLIDNALCKRFDGSVTKFLLSAEFGMGEKSENDIDNSFDFTLEVPEKDKNEI